MKRNRFQYGVIPCLILLVSVLTSEARAVTPFYLTVEKSFSDTESAQVRLDYTRTDAPLLLRVLKPVNVESFLDGQLQISRSYEKPVTELNPGHYLVKGLNTLESPLRTFRDLLDVDFRKSFKETGLHEAILTPAPDGAATAPRRIIVGPPAGFTVVREYYVNLEYGGTSAHDLGWWFWNNTWDEDAYKIRTLALDPLPDGIYLIHGVQEKAEAQSLLQVSSLSVQVKQSSSQLVVRVTDRRAQPVEGAAVACRDGRGRWISLPGKTDPSGEIAFTNSEGVLDGKLIVSVRTADNRQALTETDFLPSVAPDNSVFIVTDRPIFKPGETFYYKGVVRSFDTGELTVPPIADQTAAVSLIRADGVPADLTDTVRITDFGTFSGKFTLDDLESPGLYRLVADISGKPFGGEFRVRDYVKPVFYLELIERSPAILAGEPFHVRFRAKRYSGGSPAGLKYEVYLYRKKFEVPQWVMEAGGGLSAGTDYFGEIRSVSALTEPKRLFSSVEERLGASLDSVNTWESAPEANEAGEADFEFIIPAVESADARPPASPEPDGEWIYTLMVRAMDGAGAQAVLTENVYVTLSEAQALLRFSKPVARPEDTDLKVLIRSSYPDGKSAPLAAGVLDLRLEQIGAEPRSLPKIPFTTDDKGTASVALPAVSGAGRLGVSASLESLSGKPLKHPFVSQPIAMIVGGSDGKAVVDNRELELYSDATILSPGEKAKIFALLPAGWGRSESGVLWETVSGRKVYGTRSATVAGRSRWIEVEAKPEYGTGFYHTVTVPAGAGRYAEKTLGFRIVPEDKRLRIGIRPEREETDALQPFTIRFEVADAAGRPAAHTELAVTIVDKAVYAVQSELRPGIFDFFYPLPRQNLSTFYSDDLQGYGYADTLKKPNFNLGAIKSQSKPIKKNMRDTAGWFPHVVTDAAGQASVTVDMPANITEWVITAIAADQTGKAGEAKAFFRTVSDVSLDILAPQFLRENEKSVIYLTAVNHLTRPADLRAHIALSPDIAWADHGMNEAVRSGTVKFSIEPKGEYRLPVMIEARSGQGSALVKASIDPQKNIRAGGLHEFEIPLKPAAMSQIFTGIRDRNHLTTPLPETGTARILSVQVHSGLLGAALNAAAVLSVYPYGCTEQLVHSTIPNLVLMDLIRRTGIETRDLGLLEKPLVRAEKNAAAGIQKIIRNQKSSGGFGYWPRDPEASIPVTLTALNALRYAADMNIPRAQGAYQRGLEWLSRDRNQGSAPVLSGYELAAFAEINAYSQPYEQQAAFIQGVYRSQTASITDLIYALKIFAAFKDQTWNRLMQTYKDGAVKDALIRRLIDMAGRLDEKIYENALRSDAGVLESLGFGYGIPYLASSALGVLSELNALPADLEYQLKQTLLSSMKNGFWISTFDTARVIFNTLKLLSIEAETYHRERQNPRPVRVYHRDGLVGELSRIPMGFTGFFRNPGSMESLSDIRLEGLSPRETPYSYISAEIPFDSVRPRDQGLVVERILWRVTPRGREVFNPARFHRKGDVIISEVMVRRSPAPAGTAVPSRFVVVEDGIPSYARGIDDDRTYLADAGFKAITDTYWASVKEVLRHPDKTVTIGEMAPSGQLRVYQVWKTTFEGRAEIPPARACDMYDETIQGNSETGPRVP